MGRLESTYFVVVKCNKMKNRVYQNIVPGSVLGSIVNIGVTLSGTHPSQDVNVSELIGKCNT